MKGLRLILALAALLCASATGAFEWTLKEDHPRLYITDARIDSVFANHVNNGANGSPEWVRLVTASNRAAYTPSSLKAMAFRYAIGEQDSAYGAAICAKIDNWVSNGIVTYGGKRWFSRLAHTSAEGLEPGVSAATWLDMGAVTAWDTAVYPEWAAGQSYRQVRSRAGSSGVYGTWNLEAFNNDPKTGNDWACLYDWMYNSPDFTDTLKMKVRDYVGRIGRDEGGAAPNDYGRYYSYSYADSTGEGNPYNNGIYKQLGGYPLFGYAIYPDSAGTQHGVPQAAEDYMNAAQESWLCLRLLYGYGGDGSAALASEADGMFNSGRGYGALTSVYLGQFLDGMGTAHSDFDIATEAPGLKNMLKAYVYDWMYIDQSLQKRKYYSDGLSFAVQTRYDKEVPYEYWDAAGDSLATDTIVVPWKWLCQKNHQATALNYPGSAPGVLNWVDTGPIEQDDIDSGAYADWDDSAYYYKAASSTAYNHLAYDPYNYWIAQFGKNSLDGNTVFATWGYLPWMVSSVFPDDEWAPRARWFVMNAGGGSSPENQVEDGSFQLWAVLYKNRALAQECPADASPVPPLQHYSQWLGQWVIRSDWPEAAMDDSRVHATFQVGNRAWFSQGGAVQGNFGLYAYGDPMFTHGSAYDGNGAAPDFAYHTQTIGYNSFRILDPLQTKAWHANGDWTQEVWMYDNDGTTGANVADTVNVNSGGQNYPRGTTLKTSTTAFKDGVSFTELNAIPHNRHWTIHDAGDMVRHDGNGDYVYGLGNFTNAYANERWEDDYDAGDLADVDYRPKADLAEREFIYLRERDMIVLFDRVTSTDEDYQKFWDFHTGPHPEFLKDLAGGQPDIADELEWRKAKMRGVTEPAPAGTAYATPDYTPTERTETPRAGGIDNFPSARAGSFMLRGDHGGQARVWFKADWDFIATRFSGEGAAYWMPGFPGESGYNLHPGPDWAVQDGGFSYLGAGGFNKVELTPTEPAQVNNLHTVIRFGPQTTELASTVGRIASDAFSGVVVDGTAFAYSQDAEYSNIAAEYTSTTPLTEHFIFDMQPGTSFAVTGSGGWTSPAVASTDAGILHFTSPPVTSITVSVVTRTSPTLQFMSSKQWTFNKDAAVQGEKVATVMAYGVQLWEMADPADPALLAEHYTEGHQGWSVAWEGDLVAAATTDGLLQMFDTGNDSLEYLGQMTGLGSQADIALVRDDPKRWCYSAGSAGLDFQIRDLTSPASPGLRGGLNLAGTPNGVCVVDSTAYVSARSVGLYTVDISDPDAPVLLATDAVAGTHSGVSASGTRLALASGSAGFTLFDITDPEAPVEKATTVADAGVWEALAVRSVLVQDSTLFAICENAGALTYDISDLEAPVLTGYDTRLDIEPAEAPYYVFSGGVWADSLLYLPHWNGATPGVIVLDASSVAADTLTYLGRTTSYDYVRDVDEEGGLIFACTGSSGLVGQEHSALNTITTRGSLAIPEAWGAAAVGDLVYVASTTDGLVVTDWSDPDAPVRLDSLDVGQARQLVVDGGIAYIAAFTQGLQVVDVSDSSAVALLDSVSIYGMQSVNIAKQGNLIATADRGGGMNLWSVVDPEDIAHYANWPTGGHALDVVLSSDLKYAYLVVAGQGLQVVDVTDPEAPFLVRTIAGGATGVARDTSYLYVSQGSAGVSAFYLSPTPSNPTPIAYFNTAHDAKSLCAKSVGAYHYVYVADYSGIAALLLVQGKPLVWDELVPSL